MKSMVFKNLIIKRLIIFIVFLGSLKLCYSQNCKISKVSDTPLYIGQSGLINKWYDELKKNGSESKYQVMLIKIFGQINQKKAYYLSFDSSKKIAVVAITPDSILYSGYLNNLDKYNFDVLLKSNEPSAFLISGCKNVISSHNKSILIFCNSSENKWIEYASLDGHMKDALSENDNFIYLERIYNLVSIIFKDLKVYME